MIFLPKLNQIIPWEEFRPVLEQGDDKPRESNAGGKPIDRVLMFKLLMLQHLHNLSDEQLEYQVYDRFSFMQFPDLSGTDAVPDATTVWLFREQLTQTLTSPSDSWSDLGCKMSVKRRQVSSPSRAHRCVEPIRLFPAL